MLLTVDVGNTFVKVAVFEEVELVDKFIFELENAKSNFETIFTTYPQASKLVYVSVATIESALITWLQKKIAVCQLSHQSAFPCVNKYQTPETLGIDRMILAAGAVLVFPAKNCLVIDAGTCITYDLVTSNGVYEGGAISPGLALRYKALHAYTAKLPLLETTSPEKEIGKTTNESIHVGVVQGVLNEVEGFISKYSVNYQDLTVILTGGDANFLANRLKSTIFADENFLLKSLQRLYIYSLKK